MSCVTNRPKQQSQSLFVLPFILFVYIVETNSNEPRPGQAGRCGRRAFVGNLVWPQPNLVSYELPCLQRTILSVARYKNAFMGCSTLDYFHKVKRRCCKGTVSATYILSYCATNLQWELIQSFPKPKTKYQQSFHTKRTGNETENNPIIQEYYAERSSCFPIIIQCIQKWMIRSSNNIESPVP